MNYGSIQKAEIAGFAARFKCGIPGQKIPPSTRNNIFYLAIGFIHG
jgi:hypothetical protein